MSKSKNRPNPVELMRVFEVQSQVELKWTDSWV